MSETRATPIGRLTIVAVFFGVLWFLPPPDGISPQAMHLFAAFISAIFAVIINAMPILVAALAALVVSVLSGTLDATTAYSGFGSGFIWLIVAAFIIGRGVINSGMGNRIAYCMIAAFGKTTLGLGYSLVATDAIIAAAFPSNTARSGVLYPIALSVARGSNSCPEDGTRKKLGAYLMMNSIAGLSISSMLWMTAMAANPTGAAIARELGVEHSITFSSWFMAASVPAIIALLVLPAMLYKFFPPEMKKTPDAPKEAAAKLREMGPMSRQEWITGITFIGMVILWATGAQTGIDKTIVAFGGLTIMLLTGVLTMEDISSSGDALATLIWFAILYTMSSQLNELGFMGYLGDQLGGVVDGYSWPVVYVVLMAAYVLLHYLFVSQTAHMLALLGVFLGVGIQAQVPPALMALMLLFATNFFSSITPQGSSANVVFAGSGYLTQGELYRNGALITLTNFLIFMGIGTPWILLVT